MNPTVGNDGSGESDGGVDSSGESTGGVDGSGESTDEIAMNLLNLQVVMMVLVYLLVKL